MLIIEHRKNTIAELQKVPSSHGVEIDIRSKGDRLILHHEPFCSGDDFEEWLRHFNHAFIILNVKEEGLESRIQALLDKKGIEDYFYLDVSFPFIIKLINVGQKNIAVRFSEYESIETCLALAGKVGWVWVDCFTRSPLDRAAYEKLTKHFKLCLVSPELVGRPQDISKVKRDVSGMEIGGVCTKLPDQWLVKK